MGDFSMTFRKDVFRKDGFNCHYYHFTSDRLRDGRLIPQIGEWLEHHGDLIPCFRGLHASEHPLQALQYAPGDTLHKVELGGRIMPLEDKVVASRRRILRTVDLSEILMEMACAHAMSVSQTWDMPNNMREAIESRFRGYDFVDRSMMVDQAINCYNRLYVIQSRIPDNSEWRYMALGKLKAARTALKCCLYACGGKRAHEVYNCAVSAVMAKKFLFSEAVAAAAAKSAADEFMSAVTKAFDG